MLSKLSFDGKRRSLSGTNDFTLHYRSTRNENKKLLVIDDLAVVIEEGVPEHKALVGLPVSSVVDHSRVVGLQGADFA